MNLIKTWILFYRVTMQKVIPQQVLNHIKRLSKKSALIIHSTSCFIYHGEHHCIKINRFSPKSNLDWLMLNWTRSIADAILVSGKLLREEPELTCKLDPCLNFIEKNPKKSYLVLTNDSELFARDLAFFKSDDCSREFFVFTQNLKVVNAAKEYSNSSSIKINVEIVENMHHVFYLLQKQALPFTLSVEAGPIVSNELLYAKPFHHLPDIIILNVYDLESDLNNMDILLSNCLGNKTFPKEILDKYYERISLYEQDLWKYQIFALK
jgi:hypothetical protein